MQTHRKRALAFTLVSMVILLLLAACGADATATPLVTAGAAANEDQTSGDTMASDSMPKDGDSMASDSMPKARDSMPSDSMP